MSSRTFYLMIRGIQLAPVVACMFAGCTCSEKPAVSERPLAATPLAQKPTVVVRVVNTPQPPAPIISPSGPTSAADTAASVSQNRSACDGYIAALSGRGQDRTLLDKPEVQALGRQVPELVTCGAVRSDADDLCKLLEQGGDECRRMRWVFHELRVNPKGRSFLMTDSDYESCRKDLPAQSLPASLCDEFREAVRSGDPSKCPKGAVEGMEGFCRGIVSLDKSQCTGMGKIEDQEQGRAACEKIIDRNKHFAKGLEELAKSGPPLESELAKAALKQADACSVYEKKAVEACSAAAAAPPPAPQVTPSKPGSQLPGAPSEAAATS